MPSKQQLETALRNADASGDIEAATALANALRDGKFSDQKYQDENSDIPQVSSDGSPLPLRPRELEKSRSLSLTENPIVGGIEAATGAIAGGLAGLGGQIYGTAKGIGSSIINGTYGTNQGANAAEEEAIKYSQKASEPFMPITETGKEYLGKVADIAEPFAAAAPFSHELSIIGNSARAALPMASPVSTEASQAIRNISEKKLSTPDISAEPVPIPTESASQTQNLASSSSMGLKSCLSRARVL